MKFDRHTDIHGGFAASDDPGGGSGKAVMRSTAARGKQFYDHRTILAHILIIK